MALDFWASECVLFVCRFEKHKSDKDIWFGAVKDNAPKLPAKIEKKKV